MQYVEMYNEELRDLMTPQQQQPLCSPPRTAAAGSSTYAAAATPSANTRSTAQPAAGAAWDQPTQPAGFGVSIREAPSGEIFLEGACDLVVTSEVQLLSMVEAGNACRSTGATAMNEVSSRSHTILTLTLQQQQRCPKSGEVVVLCGKLHLVDLAGSERTKRSMAVGVRLKEAVNINQGLLALGNVISALGDETKRGCHVPYRDSKLTRLLQDSIGGNSLTTMIACISSADDSLEETFNTLKYANRARNIQNRPMVNRGSSQGQGDEHRALMLLRQVTSQLPHQQDSARAMQQLLDAPQQGTAAFCVAVLQQLLQDISESKSQGVATSPGNVEPGAAASALAGPGSAAASSSFSYSAAALESSDVLCHRVADLETQLEARTAGLAQCTAELASTNAELASTKENLAYAEELLCSKMQEVSALEKLLEAAAEAARQQHQQEEGGQKLLHPRSGPADVRQDHDQKSQIVQNVQEAGQKVTKSSHSSFGAATTPAVSQQHASWTGLEERPSGRATIVIHDQRHEESETGLYGEESFLSDCDFMILPPPVSKTSASSSLEATTCLTAALQQRMQLMVALEQDMEEQQRQQEAAKGELEGQMRELEAGIAQREETIADLQMAEAQAREATAMYQAQLEALQQALDTKEAELAQLHAELAAVGDDKARSEAEKAELKEQYEERITMAHAKLSELRRKLRDQEAARSNQEGQARADRLREEIARMKAQQSALRSELAAKAQAHDRQAQLQARELASLRREAESARRHVRQLEEEGNRQRAQLKQKEAEAVASRQRIAELTRRSQSSAGGAVSMPGSPITLSSPCRATIGGAFGREPRASPLRTSSSGGIRGVSACVSTESSKRSVGPCTSPAMGTSVVNGRVSFGGAGSARSPLRASSCGMPTKCQPGARSSRIGSGKPLVAGRPVSMELSTEPIQDATAAEEAAVAEPPNAETLVAEPLDAEPSDDVEEGLTPSLQLQPPHQVWLEQLVEAACSERQAQAALLEADQKVAELKDQRDHLDAERGRLEGRIRIRLVEVQGRMGQLRERRSELLQQLEQQRREEAALKQRHPQQAAAAGQLLLLGQLVEEAEQAGVEAHGEKLQRQLRELDDEVEELQAACCQRGAWAKLQQQERQMLDKLDRAAEGLDMALGDAAVQVCAKRDNALRAAAAGKLLLENMPAMPMPDMRHAFVYVAAALARGGGAGSRAGSTAGISGTMEQDHLAGGSVAGTRAADIGSMGSAPRSPQHVGGMPATLGEEKGLPPKPISRGMGGDVAGSVDLPPMSPEGFSGAMEEDEPSQDTNLIPSAGAATQSHKGVVQHRQPPEGQHQAASLPAVAEDCGSSTAHVHADVGAAVDLDAVQAVPRMAAPVEPQTARRALSLPESVDMAVVPRAQDLKGGTGKQPMAASSPSPTIGAKRLANRPSPGHMPRQASAGHACPLPASPGSLHPFWLAVSPERRSLPGQLGRGM